LMGKLGQGGMGSVWRAEHLALGSSLAIKLIDPGITQSPEAAVRFKREAQAAADLRSAHVVQIIDYGVDDGLPFIAMELLDGESLGARLERMGRLAPDQAASILSQVARALARAHQAGVVHRDLKPDNVFLVREADGDIVKVLDFGIAKKLGVLSTTSGIKTGTGAMLGTPYYMSPEQVLGGSDIDHRADIWSLGIIAYECLTGQRPFEKETLGGLLMAICNDPLPVPSKVASVPSGFDAWFARACARDTSARFDSAIEATADLRTVCGVSVEPPPPPEPVPHRGLWAAAAVVGVMAVLWVTRAITPSSKAESVLVAKASITASPEAVSAPASASSPVLAPLTPAAVAVDSTGPIARINELPMVLAHGQARHGPAPKNTALQDTQSVALGNSESLPEAPPLPASAAPAQEAVAYGTLNVNSIPVSSILVDGRPMGSTPKMGLGVNPGIHTIVFVHPELGRKVVTVTVAAGQTQTAATRFERHE
jgi:serine/threonine-protein kinase